jgi:hypothetical protein
VRDVLALSDLESIEFDEARVPIRDAAKGDSGFIASLVDRLTFRLEREPQQPAPVAARVVALCAYVIEHWARFEVDAEIDGNVRNRFEALRGAFSRLADTPPTQGLEAS